MLWKSLKDLEFEFSSMFALELGVTTKEEFERNKFIRRIFADVCGKVYTYNLFLENNENIEFLVDIVLNEELVTEEEIKEEIYKYYILYKSKLITKEKFQKSKDSKVKKLKKLSKHRL